MYQISQCKNNKNVARTQHFFLQMPFVRNILHSLKHEIALSNNLKTDVYNTKRHVVFPIRFFFVYSYSGAFLPCLAPNAPTILRKILIVGHNLVIF